MKIYVLFERNDSISDLRERITLIKSFEPPPKVYLVASGPYSWEMAIERLGIDGLILRKDIPFYE